MSLDTWPDCRYRRCMAHSYLIFDFGKDEETAQHARHKVESWKQGFRLGNKLTIKFEREEPEEENAAAEENAEASAKHPAEKHSAASKHGGEGKRGGKKKSSAKRAKAAEGVEDEEEPNANVRVIVRLDFSDHEKLSPRSRSSPWKPQSFARATLNSVRPTNCLRRSASRHVAAPPPVARTHRQSGA
jgi:hypothetical protein